MGIERLVELEENQWMLKPSTTYLIRCVADVDNVDFGAYLRLGQK